MSQKQGENGGVLNGAPRVLVVEDHADTLVLLGKLLAKIPVDAIPTQDCAGARAAAQRFGGFDMVIADHSLPDGNGADLLAELKDQFGCATIVVSGHPAPVGALPAGVDQWVPKPVDLAALTLVVRSAMRAQPQSLRQVSYGAPSREKRGQEQGGQHQETWLGDRLREGTQGSFIDGGDGDGDGGVGGGVAEPLL
jgi:DNA-binding response OmpR family regulator